MTTPLAWVHAHQGHELALDGTDLRCRKPGGKVLRAVPAAVRESPVGERFEALREQVLRHERECRATVESWLLGDVPVPGPLLARVWDDTGWRVCLRHLVVRVEGRLGLLDDVSGDGRASVREADGTRYEASAGAAVTLVHPVLLDDPDGWRLLLAELGGAQGVEQVDRRVHRRRPGRGLEGVGVEVSGGAYAYAAVSGAARRRAVEHGFAVRGGFAVLGVRERGAAVEVRCWLGSEEAGGSGASGSGEAGRLLWVDGAERPLPVGEVGPMAWSEGRRMAELVYGETDARGNEER
ncbi:DUF4132 domain-containing protein [Streptomyces sp. NPDC127108]|uniref:DUF4132 domain-containing protein n=1 Tax=Streptomyces sp. NPDC127108 TaxID=3345361 RepID=UPI00362ED50E